MGLIWGCYLGGAFAVLQAPMFDGLAFDAGPLAQDVGGYFAALPIDLFAIWFFWKARKREATS